MNRLWTLSSSHCWGIICALTWDCLCVFLCYCHLRRTEASNILFPTSCSACQRWRPNSQPWRANDQKVIETAGGWLKASLLKPNKGLEFDPQNLGKGRKRDLIPRSGPLTFICVLACAPPHARTQSLFLNKNEWRETFKSFVGTCTANHRRGYG